MKNKDQVKQEAVIINKARFQNDLSKVNWNIFYGLYMDEFEISEILENFMHIVNNK